MGRVLNCEQNRPRPDDPNALYVGRRSSIIHRDVPGADGRWGNRHVVGKHGTRQEVVTLYEREVRDRIAVDAETRDAVRAMYGKDLYCWCAPLPCHGDVLKCLAEELHDDERMDSEMPGD